jgi:hypothetical protein
MLCWQFVILELINILINMKKIFMVFVVISVSIIATCQDNNVVMLA